MILRWNNCTCAEKLVQLFPHKFERIDRPTRHVLLHLFGDFKHLINVLRQPWNCRLRYDVIIERDITEPDIDELGVTV